jgi:hypothetical protein
MFRHTFHDLVYDLFVLALGGSRHVVKALCYEMPTRRE